MPNGVLLVDYHVPVWLTIPAGGLAASLVSLLVGVPSLRLKGLYLAITTLAFSFIVNHVILYAESVTHGPNGIFVNGARLLGFDVQKGPPLYYLTLAIALATLFAALNLSRTRIGRAWLAIRDHDIAARVMGIDLVRYKLRSPSSSAPSSSASPARSRRCSFALSTSMCSRSICRSKRSP